MKKILVSFLFLVLLSLASCSSIHNSEIIIGFANSLDYSFGNLGVDSMYGAMLAVDEINELGGINGQSLKLIIRDDGRDPLKAVEVDNELMDLGAVAIIGHGYSITAEAIINNANSKKILLISPTISTNIVSNLDDMFIRVTPSTLEQGYSLANAMHEFSPGDVLIVYESQNSNFTIDYKNAFVEKYESLGHTVSTNNIYSFDINNVSNYHDIANIINSSEINNVLALGSAFDVANIVQRIDSPENVNFYLSAWSGTSDLIGLSGPNIDNSISINFLDLDSNNTNYNTFKQTYLNNYGVEYSYASVFGYESVYLLKETLESTNDWSAENLKNVIISKQTYSGIINDYSMNQYGDVQRTIYYYRIVDGEFITIGSDEYV